MNALSEHVLAEKTAHRWCLALCGSIQHHDIEGLMRLVSQRIHVYGIPSKETLNYRQWRSRYYNDFSNDTLVSVTFKGIRILTHTPKRLRFNTLQTVLGKEGKMVLLDKNITLEFEDDQAWRVIEEEIKSWQVKRINMASFQAGCEPVVRELPGLAKPSV